jgi:exosortase
MAQVEDARLVVPTVVKEPLHLAAPWTICVGVAVVLSYIPLLVLHAQHLWERSEQYGYCIFLPLGAYILARQQLAGIGKLSGGSTWLFGFMMLFSLLMQTFAVAVFSPWLGAVSFLFAILAIIYGLGGWTLMSRLFSAWCLCWLAIPLPFNLDTKLVTSLQTITAHWSSRLLDAIGVLHVMSGNAVEIPGHRLMVEEACSGVQSLFACLCATIFFVLWTQQPKVRGTLVVLSSIGWVLVANAVRVVLITKLTQEGFQVLEGLPHELLGMGVFVFTLLMVISTDRLFMFFLPPRAFRTKPRAAAGKLRLPDLESTGFGSTASLPLAAGYALLAVAQLYLLWPTTANAAPLVKSSVTLEKRLNLNALPEQWQDWKRVGYETKARDYFYGEFSRYWVYQGASIQAVASIDYPFTDRHNLIGCYQSIGWQIVSEKLKPATKDLPPRVEVEMRQSELRWGTLVFYLFDNQGKPIEPQDPSSLAKFTERVKSIEKTWRSAGRQLADQEERVQYYQLQVFSESFSKPTEAQRQQVKDFFLEMCRELQTNWLVAPKP